MPFNLKSWSRPSGITATVQQQNQEQIQNLTPAESNVVANDKAEARVSTVHGEKILVDLSSSIVKPAKESIYNIIDISEAGDLPVEIVNNGYVNHINAKISASSEFLKTSESKKINEANNKRNRSYSNSNDSTTIDSFKSKSSIERSISTPAASLVNPFFIPKCEREQQKIDDTHGRILQQMRQQQQENIQNIRRNYPASQGSESIGDNSNFFNRVKEQIREKRATTNLGNNCISNSCNIDLLGESTYHYSMCKQFGFNILDFCSMSKSHSLKLCKTKAPDYVTNDRFVFRHRLPVLGEEEDVNVFSFAHPRLVLTIAPQLYLHGSFTSNLSSLWLKWNNRVNTVNNVISIDNDPFVLSSKKQIVTLDTESTKISSWLESWTNKKGITNSQTSKKRASPRSRYIDNDYDFDDSYTDIDSVLELSQRNPLVIYGCTSSGKTSSVYNSAEKLGYNVIEISIPNLRSGSELTKVFSEAVKSHGVQTSSATSIFTDKIEMANSAKMNLLLLDEVDLCLDDVNTTNGIIVAILDLVKISKIPIVLTTEKNLLWLENNNAGISYELVTLSRHDRIDHTSRDSTDELLSFICHNDFRLMKNVMAMSNKSSDRVNKYDFLRWLSDQCIDFAYFDDILTSFAKKQRYVFVKWPFVAIPKLDTVTPHRVVCGVQTIIYLLGSNFMQHSSSHYRLSVKIGNRMIEESSIRVISDCRIEIVLTPFPFSAMNKPLDVTVLLVSDSNVVIDSSIYISSRQSCWIMPTKPKLSAYHSLALNSLKSAPETSRSQSDVESSSQSINDSTNRLLKRLGDDGNSDDDFSCVQDSVHPGISRRVIVEEDDDCDKLHLVNESKAIVILQEASPSETISIKYNSSIALAFYKALQDSLNFVLTQRDIEAFKNTISDVEVPNYSSIIESPICLHDIYRKLENHEYESTDIALLREFISDLRLVVNNCIVFNGKGSFLSRIADRLSVIANERMALRLIDVINVFPNELRWDASQSKLFLRDMSSDQSICILHDSEIGQWVNVYLETLEELKLQSNISFPLPNEENGQSTEVINVVSVPEIKRGEVTATVKDIDELIAMEQTLANLSAMEFCRYSVSLVDEEKFGLLNLNPDFDSIQPCENLDDGISGNTAAFASSIYSEVISLTRKIMNQVCEVDFAISKQTIDENILNIDTVDKGFLDETQTNPKESHFNSFDANRSVFKDYNYLLFLRDKENFIRKVCDASKSLLNSLSSIENFSFYTPSRFSLPDSLVLDSLPLFATILRFDRTVFEVRCALATNDITLNECTGGRRSTRARKKVMQSQMYSYVMTESCGVESAASLQETLDNMVHLGYIGISH